jgi:RNA polymerase sigma-70 factor (ECF subfamily)
MNSQGPRSELDDVWREHRAYVVDLAFRMLGNIADAEDVVQEAFTRLLRVELDEIDDVRAWLVVVVGRLCLDHLRSARVRREAPADASADAPLFQDRRGTDPLDRITLDDNVRIALLVLLQRLTPPERAAFILHDVFQLSFDDIASVVGRSPSACRQLASRARRRIQSESGLARFDVSGGEQQRVVEQFIAACAGGNIDALAAVLDPDVVGEVDIFGRRFVGFERVSGNLLALFGKDSNKTLVSLPAPNQPAVLAFQEGRLYAILVLTIRDGVVHHIHGIADRRQLDFVGEHLARAADG